MSIERMGQLQPKRTTSPLPHVIRRKHQVCVSAILLAASFTIDSTNALDFRVGAEFSQTLQSSASILWHDVPFASGLQSLQNVHRIAIMLDRRVDPDRPVTCDVSGVSLQDALRSVARQEKLGVGTVGPVVVLGPPKSMAVVATQVAILETRIQQFDEPLRSSLMEQRSWSWPRLATPVHLVAHLADEVDLQVTNARLIPHDLWSARELPSMTWPERMQLILTGFDLTFELDESSRSMKIVPLPGQLSISREYRVRGDANAEARKWSKEFPRAFIRVEGGTITVRSLIEDHWAIHGLQQRADTPSRRDRSDANLGTDRRRYTLTVQNEPLEPLLNVLARRTEVEWTIDESAREALGNRVSFSVQEVTLIELFQAAVADAGLTAELKGQQVYIRKNGP